jgi:transcriptional regulator GlxA family with amidase domain
MPQNKAANSPKTSVYPAFPSAERISSLKELMELEEQRSGLENSLQILQEKIDEIQRELFSAETRHVRSRLKELRRPRINGRRRMARGELRAQILQQLETAGSEGVNVHAIAARLGMKAVNIHSWFHTAIKRFPQIRKSGPSHYHLSSSLGDLANLTDVPVTHDLSSSGVATPGGRRGEVTKSIINALKKAGKSGLSVSEIAASIGSSYRRVHVWLSSTGKKNKLVVRLARGTYQLDERLAAEPARTEN